MPALLHVTSFGHAGSKSVSELENIIQAGKGYNVHAGNVPSSAHDVINEAQHVTSDVMQDAAKLPDVVTAKFPHVQQSVSHTWNSAEIKTLAPIAIHIPEHVGWL